MMMILTLAYVGLGWCCSGPGTIRMQWGAFFAVAAGRIVTTVALEPAVLVVDAARGVAITLASAANGQVGDGIVVGVAGWICELLATLWLLLLLLSVRRHNDAVAGGRCRLVGHCCCR